MGGKVMKLGAIYEVKFLDHAQHNEGSSGALEFTVYGRLVKETKKTIDIRTWDASDPLDDHNVEGFTIVKGAIIKARVLR